MKESFLERGRRLDAVRPPDCIRRWLSRIQLEYYCDMDSMPKRQCHCNSWDPTHPLYRFYLCPNAKPMWQLAFKKVFENGDKRRTS